MNGGSFVNKDILGVINSVICICSDLIQHICCVYFVVLVSEFP